jgi:hypothetical protein
MFVIPADLEHEIARLREYAVTHSMAVVFANFGRHETGIRFVQCHDCVEITGVEILLEHTWPIFRLMRKHRGEFVF